jgi:hypothetical protein
MPHPLLDQVTINSLPQQYLSQVGRIFAEFGADTQDSGNLSYGVQVGGERYFVKTAGPPDDPRPVGAQRIRRDDPRSAFQRFRRLPPDNIQRCLDVV